MAALLSNEWVLAGTAIAAIFGITYLYRKSQKMLNGGDDKKEK